MPELDIDRQIVPRIIMRRGGIDQTQAHMNIVVLEAFREVMANAIFDERLRRAALGSGLFVAHFDQVQPGNMQHVRQVPGVTFILESQIVMGRFDRAELRYEKLLKGHAHQRIHEQRHQHQS